VRALCNSHPPEQRQTAVAQYGGAECQISRPVVDIGVEGAALQVEEFEQKEREKDADDPEQDLDIGTIEVKDDDRNRRCRSDKPECREQTVRSRLVRSRKFTKPTMACAAVRVYAPKAGNTSP